MVLSVPGPTGVLLIDPGLTEAEMTCLVDDLRELGQSVVAGFATHPDWDHLLWHPEYGDAPRSQIIEHPAYAPGHAAMLIAERGVLVAGE
ncbi:MBL fold metallo-hydrolase [Streptomyces sp. NPDC017230]|uniref:MBL fold metallo-hydrolase n=1 Tax=unclassified Streptomyces TaxID=2593676 RepID=UPI0037A6DDA0